MTDEQFERFAYVVLGVAVVGWLAFWGGVAFVVLHFVVKAW